MKLRTWAAGVVSVVASMVGAPGASATCPPSWQPGFPNTDAGGTVLSMVVFDDGSGPALFAAGSFSAIGGVSASRVAKFDGLKWSALERGLNTTVNQLIVYNGALHAVGAFVSSGTGAGSTPVNRVARWTGSAWVSVGSGTNNGVGGTVNAAAIYNGELYLGGVFTTAGTVANVANIAKWNGSAWSAVGSGFNADVKSLGVFTDGGVPKLFAGGTFNTSGALTNLRGVARWDGASWAAAGSGFTGTTISVNAFAFFGGSIYAGGTFTGSGINSLSNVARWTGTQWTDVGAGVTGTGTVAVNTMLAHDDGSGSALFVGGAFTLAGGTVASGRLAKWTGADWQSTGGLGGTSNSLATYDDGTGPALWIGGAFTTVGASGDAADAARIAQWNGTVLSSGGRGISGTVGGMTQMGSGPGAELVAFGVMTRAGNTRVGSVARYNGSSWSPMGASSFDATPTSAVEFQGSLYVAGGFTNYGVTQMRRVARWNGSDFVEANTVINNAVNAIAVHNNALYAGGAFSVPVGRVAMFNGTTWVALGAGLNNAVNDIISYNGRLIATGTFTTAGGNPASRIAQWDGTAWTAMGNGLNNTGLALAVYRNELFVCGTFTTAGAGAAARVARWNGSAWSDAGGGMDAQVDDLVVINDAGTETLFAVGTFTTASGSDAAKIAYWNGCRWIAIGSGFGGDPTNGSPTVNRLGSVNAGPAKGVYATGLFASAGGVSAHNIARLAVCSTCPADLDDGSATGTPDFGVTIDDLVYYLGGFAAGDLLADLDDGSGTGQCDGGVTIDDLVYLLQHFADGC